MNGRLDKVEMTAKVTRMKNGVDSKAWYPEWDNRQRGAASRILTNVLEQLDEYWTQKPNLFLLGNVIISIGCRKDPQFTLAFKGDYYD